MIYGKIIKQEPKYKVPELTDDIIEDIKQILPNWFKEKYHIELGDNKKILDDKYWITTADLIRVLNNIKEKM